MTRHVLAWRLAKATGDREEATRVLERASSSVVTEPMPAAMEQAWHALVTAWVGAWRPAPTAAQEQWARGGPSVTVPAPQAGDSPLEQRLTVLRNGLRQVAGRVRPFVEAEPLGSRFEPEPLASAFLLAARPPAGSDAEPWRALLSLLDEGGLQPAGALAACRLLDLLRAELADSSSPLHGALDQDDFARHWRLLTYLSNGVDPQPTDREVMERLRCVACYSLMPQVRDAAETRLARWAVSRPAGDVAAAAFCAQATPFLLHAADRLPEAPALLDRVIRHVWLHDPEPARGDAYVNLRTTLHRLPVDLRPPEDWAWRGVPRSHAALVEKATESVLRESLARARERCVQRYRAATEAALREWARRLSGPL